MSSRHVRRLQQQLPEDLPVCENDEEEEEEEEEDVPKRPMFTAFDESDDSDESSEEEDDDDARDVKTASTTSLPVPVPVPATVPAKPEVDEDAYLDELLSTMKTEREVESTAYSPDEPQGFALEARELDFDLASRRKVPFPLEGAPALASKVPGNSSNKRKLLFGQPQQTWSRPVAFAFGGASLSRVKFEGWSDSYFFQEYAFELSTEMLEKCSKLERILSTWCPNRLVLFNVHSQAQVPLALYNLSMHFSGNAALSRELNRRALYLLDYTLSDSFCTSALQGKAAMNPNDKNNEPFFLVLLRHMKQCATGTTGNDRKLNTATAVAKLLISLGRNWRRNELMRRRATSSSSISSSEATSDCEADPFKIQSLLDCLLDPVSAAGPLHSLLPDPPSAPHVRNYLPIEESLSDPRLLEMNPAVEHENTMVRASVARWGVQTGLGADGSGGLGGADDGEDKSVWAALSALGLDREIAGRLLQQLQVAAPERQGAPAVAHVGVPAGVPVPAPGAAVAARRHSDSGLVDFNAPLLQLFLQTLLPFFHG